MGPLGALFDGLFRSDHSSSIDELKKSLEINPSFAPAHTHTGIARVYDNQVEAGLSSLDEAERLSPPQHPKKTPRINRLWTLIPWKLFATPLAREGARL